MSATISQPTTGHKSAAPFAAVAILAGAVALGAVALAVGQGIKATPAAGTPVDVQAALIEHRAAERASLETARDPRLVVAGSELQDRLDGAFIATDPRLLVNAAELRDRLSGSTGTGTGPQTSAQKGLVGPDRWSVMAGDKAAQQQMSRIAVPAPRVFGPARHPNAR